jgi:hypothetical protein
MNPKVRKKKTKRELQYGYQCKTKEIFIASDASCGYSIGVLLIPSHPLECAVSRTVHRAPVIQTVKQIV